MGLNYSMDKQQEAKPCPFCGEQPLIEVERTDISEALGADEFNARIRCANPTCAVKPFYGPVISASKEISQDADQTRQAAIACWNVRKSALAMKRWQAENSA